MAKRLLVGIAITALVIAGSFYYAYRQVIELGYPSCALSIEDAISLSIGRGALKGVIVSDEWQTLGEAEERAIFAEFQSAGLKFDCYQFPQFADGSALVGDKGQIRFRKEGKLIRVRIESDEGHERPY